MPPDSPIVVLDSGLGGLTVVRALRAQLPAEEIVYFGDTARLPYGSKTAATVTTFVRQIIQYLLPQNPKHVVVACNTATALALPAVRAAFPGLPISGVIEPGSKAAVVAAGAKQVPIIGVLATEATIRSKAYERAIHRRRNHARLLLRPAPLLVPIIEEGRRPDDPLVRLAIQQYLEPLLRYRLDVLVLGCTHYPILKDAIASVAGPTVRVIDSAEQCAQDVAHRLRGTGLLKAPAGVKPLAYAPYAGLRGDARSIRQGAPGAAGMPGTPESPGAARAADGGGALRCFVTDDAPRFAALASQFLGGRIDPPTWVPPEQLYAPPPASQAAATLRVPA